MKVLNIKQLYFQLPDDFKDGLYQALINMVEYHKEIIDKNKSRGVEEKEMSKSEIQNQFLFNLGKGKRLTGELSIVEIRDNQMIPIMRDESGRVI